MGFCTKAEYEEFMSSVQDFEGMLVRSGIKLLKYYLDVSRAEQRRRLKDRRGGPLTRWKASPIDDAAMKYWKPYSRARDEMLARTHSVLGPWTVVRADDKRLARINLIKDLLGRLHYAYKDAPLIRADRRIVFAYDPSDARRGRLAK